MMKFEAIKIQNSEKISQLTRLPLPRSLFWTYSDLPHLSGWMKIMIIYWLKAKFAHTSLPNPQNGKSSDCLSVVLLLHTLKIKRILSLS
jgi:hypothetical protein